LHLFTLQIKTPKEFREDLVKWVICDNQPFTVVESSLFRNLFSTGHQDNIKNAIPSADTIKLDVMKSFTNKKEQD
jgi:hypothetical protein